MFTAYMHCLEISLVVTLVDHKSIFSCRGKSTLMQPWTTRRKHYNKQPTRIQKLKRYRWWKKSRRYFLTLRGETNIAFDKTCTDEQLSLIADQEQLRLSYRSMYVAPPSLSLTSTMMSIIKYAEVDPRSAQRLQNWEEIQGSRKKTVVSNSRLSESDQWAVQRTYDVSCAKPPIPGSNRLHRLQYKGIWRQKSYLTLTRWRTRSMMAMHGMMFCVRRKSPRNGVVLEEGAQGVNSCLAGDGGRLPTSNVNSKCNNLPYIQKRLCDKHIM